jgi:hypothetical protein
MYNHRNGKYLNTEVTTYEGEKHVTVAARDIQPGEQIHNSYNKCKECGGRRVGYGTAGKWVRVVLMYNPIDAAVSYSHLVLFPPVRNSS